LCDSEYLSHLLSGISATGDDGNTANLEDCLNKQISDLFETVTLSLCGAVDSHFMATVVWRWIDVVSYTLQKSSKVRPISSRIRLDEEPQGLQTLLTQILWVDGGPLGLGTLSKLAS
jgi:hypothetical protein